MNEQVILSNASMVCLNIFDNIYIADVFNDKISIYEAFYTILVKLIIL